MGGGCSDDFSDRSDFVDRVNKTDQSMLNDLVRESPGPTETTPVHLILVSPVVMSVLVVVRDGTGLLKQEAFILVVKILQGGES